jgi:hypothetical protein
MQAAVKSHSFFMQMKRHWIEYRPTRVYGPMTYWVHREADDKPQRESKRHEPPMQPAIPGKGFPLLFVEYGDFTFSFASLAEIRVAVEILGQKLLPTTLRLSAERGGTVGPNTHWLSRLPSRVLAWRYRERAVEYMARSLADFHRELGHSEA